MPAGPNHAQENARVRESKTSGETRKGITSPSDFFAGLKRSGDDDSHDHEVPRCTSKAWPGSLDEAIHECDGKLDRRHVADRERIPLPTRTPQKHASQQRTCSRPSFRSCCEPQCNDRRSKDPRNEDSRPSREDRRNEERPRDCVRQQEKLCQRAHVRKLRSGCATVSEPLRQAPREAGVGAVLVIQHVLDECCIHDDRAADLTLNSGGQLIRAAPELSETEVPERALG